MKYQNICGPRHFIIVSCISSDDWDVIQRLIRLIISVNILDPCCIIKDEKVLSQATGIIIHVAFIICLRVWGRCISGFNLVSATFHIVVMWTTTENNSYFAIKSGSRSCSESSSEDSESLTSDESVSSLYQSGSCRGGILS